MAIRVECPACSQRLRVPEALEGSHVPCPSCHLAVLVPLQGRPSAKALALAAPAAPSAGVRAAPDLEAAPPAVRLGVVALVLGLAAVVVLCVPVLGYASFGLSGGGLLVGLWGLLKYGSRDAGAAGGPADGPPAARADRRAWVYPLAGVLVCLGAALLALLPFLLAPG
jgi:hypothetical protein